MPSNQNPWDYDVENPGSVIKNQFDSSNLKNQYLQITKYYRNAKNQIEREILDALANGKSVSYLKERQTTINSIYNEMRKNWNEFTASSTAEAYNQGASLAHQMLQNSKVIRDYGNVPSVKNKIKLQDRPITDPKVIDSLSLDSVAYMNNAIDNGVTNVNRLFRGVNKVVSDILDETKLNDIIASGLVKGNTPTAVKEELFAELIKKHGTGPLIINGRRYQPDKYAEMLARTRIREAQTQGVLRQAEAQGNDLVRVSDHSTLTKICQEFEGKIYSISGKSKKYPKLSRSTPFHPNCLHVTTIWIDVSEILGYNPYEKEDAAMEQVSNERRERLVKSLEDRKAAKKAKSKKTSSNSSNTKESKPNKPIVPSQVSNEDLQKYKTEINLGSLSKSDNELNPVSVADTFTTAENLKDKVDYYMTQWAGYSESYSAVLMKEAVRKEFGAKGLPLSGNNSYTFSEMQINEAGKVVRDIYEQTQKDLIGLFPSGKITLYKGIYEGPDRGKKGVLSSWTTDKNTALGFTDKNNPEIIVKEFTIDKVFNFYQSSTWQEGKFGKQFEFIIME